MATAKQVQANGRNARQSTGPRTAAGKARSAGNAVTHGLFCRQVRMSVEDAEVFRVFHGRLWRQFAPAGPMEELLADRAISEAWRLQRVVRMERDWLEEAMEDQEADREILASCGPEPLRLGRWVKLEFEGSAMERLRLYEMRIERSMYRALRELERLQAMRRSGRPAYEGQAAEELVREGLADPIRQPDEPPAATGADEAPPADGAEGKNEPNGRAQPRQRKASGRANGRTPSASRARATRRAQGRRMGVKAVTLAKAALSEKQSQLEGEGNRS